MTSINLKVKGMHCASCETILKESLEESSAVESAEVSFKRGTAVVRMKPGCDAKIVRDIIKKEGYEVE